MINKTLQANQHIRNIFSLTHLHRMVCIQITVFITLSFISFKLFAQAPVHVIDPKTYGLFRVIRSGSASELEHQLANGASANDSLNGYTALMAATLCGTVEQMKILIDHGAKVNYEADRGVTALWLAVPDLDKTSLLLDHGADIQHKVEDYGILVKVASMSGAIKAFQLLIDRGADPKKSAPANFLLYSAAGGGDTAIIGLLLRMGMNANDTASFGDYPINSALNYRNSDAVKLLVDHGANVNVQPQSFGLQALLGFSPLMFAAVSNDKASFYYLLDHGANVNLKTKKGYTALMLLQDSEIDDPEMTMALIKHGAVITEKANDGTDAMYYAQRKGSTKSVELLKSHANK